MAGPRTTLANRPLDLCYFIFFVLHAFATIVIDGQAMFFAENLSPTWFRQAFIFAARDDPLLANATNFPCFIWFQTFILLEIAFQLPVFYYGARGLWRGSEAIYPLLVIYGASASTTTLACLTTMLFTASNRPNLSTLLPSYLPFFIIPLYMAVDFSIRLVDIVKDRDTLLASRKAE